MATNTPKHPSPQLTHDQIAQRARALWAQRGNPPGRDVDHWLEAERQLRAEAERRPAPAADAAVPGVRPRQDLDEAEKQLDGLMGNAPSLARRTPSGEQL